MFMVETRREMLAADKDWDDDFDSDLTGSEGSLPVHGGDAGSVDDNQALLSWVADGEADGTGPSSESQKKKV